MQDNAPPQTPLRAMGIRDKPTALMPGPDMFSVLQCFVRRIARRVLSHYDVIRLSPLSGIKAVVQQTSPE